VRVGRKHAAAPKLSFRPTGRADDHRAPGIQEAAKDDHGPVEDETTVNGGAAQHCPMRHRAIPIPTAPPGSTHGTTGSSRTLHDPPARATSLHEAVLLPNASE